MKALILAAGLGTRLAPITNEVPKSLVPVNGKPILMKQIENLYQNNITDITIIAGYKSSVLTDAVTEKYPEINIIDNVDFKTTNNMYSAYLGKAAMGDSDFLMMNADVFYDASVIKSLLLHKAPNAIVTDLGIYIEESMKVVEKNGRLVEISKQISPEETLGASIDVYKFSYEAGARFFEKCKEFIEDKRELQMWSEVALNAILSEVEFVACPLEGRWLEIDNHEDLVAAEKLFA
ncbi:nucleotidyl transferase WchZ [Streptococcus pneumoniae]|uniref:NTP transferase domain-containing protein n=2 Tax=Streptococcus pneumoniae TaxID=1313 RepID=O85005_STREE|nr:phosphocholine cytidylyltransferase family protein [Streptococcus pneumoniae]EGI88105.1 nucleotidyl transferase family protein [Streptococcus pneumoniae GA41301]EHE06801.1 nucleotidyl transferase family protein [Streptococcus pneumoniae GA17227]EHE54060.1 nucleotidyl transferase family protein [Streptococcus pneumoniae Netherlands15B-37]EHZ96614.1 nucleotidyl transferase family protein [Streptococcus pneumoniae EU-NP05]EOB26391.1 nucleotidyl transferase WchZ [Streptococcus pneumoniae 357]E